MGSEQWAVSGEQWAVSSGQWAVSRTQKAERSFPSDGDNPASTLNFQVRNVGTLYGFVSVAQTLGAARLDDCAFFLLTAHCLLLTVRAQKPDPIDTVRIDTDLVNLNVSVFNRNSSKTVAPLEQKDFAVVESGEPQEILVFRFSGAAHPFDLVLLLILVRSELRWTRLADLIRKFKTSFCLMPRAPPI